MERNPTLLTVVAAAICDRPGRLLLQQRRAGKRHAGLWEFPGGKVEPGEDPPLALVREIAEELALTLDPAGMRLVGSAEEAARAGHPGVALQLYACSLWRGVPAGLEGQLFGWYAPGEAKLLPLAPMDRHLLEAYAG